MSARNIHFYFDFLSPYAYLAHHRLRHLLRSSGYSLQYHPVDLEWIKLKAGNTGPKTRDMPLKIAYARTDLRRWAARYGVTLIPLKSYASSRMAKGVFFAEDRGLVPQYVRLAWEKTYGEGNDINDDDVLSSIARTLGWESVEFLTFLQSVEADNRFDASNQQAHDRGVFGVPMMTIGDEMWWGNDRIDLMAQYLSDRVNG